VLESRLPNKSDTLFMFFGRGRHASSLVRFQPSAPCLLPFFYSYFSSMSIVVICRSRVASGDGNNGDDGVFDLSLRYLPQRAAGDHTVIICYRRSK
jgi:hypothetical protein